MQYDFLALTAELLGSEPIDGTEGLQLYLSPFSLLHSGFRISFRCFKLGIPTCGGGGRGEGRGSFISSLQGKKELCWQSVSQKRCYILWKSALGQGLEVLGGCWPPGHAIATGSEGKRCCLGGHNMATASRKTLCPGSTEPPWSWMEAPALLQRTWIYLQDLAWSSFAHLWIELRIKEV